MGRRWGSTKLVVAMAPRRWGRSTNKAVAMALPDEGTPFLPTEGEGFTAGLLEFLQDDHHVRGMGD